MKTVQPIDAEVALIGAGPIGIELAAGLKHAGVSYVQFEAGPIGSTIFWWAPFTRFFSSPERIELCGVPLQSVEQEKTTREQYLAYLRAVVEQFGLRIERYTRVDQIVRMSDGFIIHTSRSARGVGDPRDAAAQPRVADAEIDGRRTWNARKIVLAIGNMHRPRMLSVPGEGLPHVSHYFQDPHEYFPQRVLIVGGRNSAVEAAIRLHRAGARVAISYRRAAFDSKRVKYWLRPELEWLVAKRKIAFHPETTVSRIDHDSVELSFAQDAGRSQRVAADHVLILTGYVQSGELFDQLGIERAGDERGPVLDAATMETSAPGVYVAGTAASGSPCRTTLFIENSHVHVARIVRAIAGAELPWASGDEYSALAES